MVGIDVDPNISPDRCWCSSLATEPWKLGTGIGLGVVKLGNEHTAWQWTLKDYSEVKAKSR